MNDLINLGARANVDTVGRVVQQKHLRPDGHTFADDHLLQVSSTQGAANDLRRFGFDLKLLEKLADQRSLLGEFHYWSAEHQLSEREIHLHTEIHQQRFAGAVSRNV